MRAEGIGSVRVADAVPEKSRRSDLGGRAGGAVFGRKRPAKSSQRAGYLFRVQRTMHDFRALVKVMMRDIRAFRRRHRRED